MGVGVCNESKDKTKIPRIDNPGVEDEPGKLVLDELK